MMKNIHEIRSNTVDFKNKVTNERVQGSCLSTF